MGPEADERTELLLALHHTLAFAELLLEQVRRLRLALEDQRHPSAEEFASLRAEEANGRAQIAAIRQRLAASTIEPPSRPQ